jgi:ubiquinone/menaquinone biosynthesis C-methylase UbiE
VSEVGGRLFAAAYDRLLGAADRRVLRAHRTALAAVDGVVLDIGCGTGTTFPYFEDDRPGRVFGVDPNPYMARRAASSEPAQAEGFDLGLAVGESLPVQSGSIDAVVAGLVLCSVADPDQVLEEVVRVLRPGGEFRLLEHVADTGVRADLQRILEPAWRPIAGGCHLTRATLDLVRERPRLELVEMETHRGLFPVAPIVSATVRRR